MLEMVPSMSSGFTLKQANVAFKEKDYFKALLGYMNVKDVHPELSEVAGFNLELTIKRLPLEDGESPQSSTDISSDELALWYLLLGYAREQCKKWKGSAAAYEEVVNLKGYLPGLAFRLDRVKKKLQ